KPMTAGQPSRLPDREGVWAVIRYGPQDARQTPHGWRPGQRTPAQRPVAADGPMVLGPRLVLSAPSERKSFDNGAVAHRSATAEHGRRPPPEGGRASAARTGAARTLRVIERWRPCGAGWRSPEVAGHE